MISISGKQWEEKKVSKNLVEKLKQDHKFSEIISKLIISRNFDNEKNILEAKSMGINDLNKKYELNEIVKGDSLFCASGITSSEVLKGTISKEDKYISETLVTHKSSNFKKVVKCVNPINEWFLLLEKIGHNKKLIKI